MTEQNQPTFAGSSLRKCQVAYRFCSSRLVEAIAGRKRRTTAMGNTEAYGD